MYQAIVLTPLTPPILMDVLDGADELAKLLSGYPAELKLYDDVYAYYNEQTVDSRLKINPYATGICRSIRNDLPEDFAIYGHLVITGSKRENGDLFDVPEYVIQQLGAQIINRSVGRQKSDLDLIPADHDIVDALQTSQLALLRDIAARHIVEADESQPELYELRMEQLAAVEEVSRILDLVKGYEYVTVDPIPPYRSEHDPKEESENPDSNEG